MQMISRALRRIVHSDACAGGTLAVLRRFFYPLKFSLFASSTNFALLHPRPCYPVHGLIVPRRRVYAFYNLEAEEMEHALRDGLRAARLLPWRAEDREALVWINGGPFQTFAQAHFHIFARKTPSVIEPIPVRRGDGWTLCACMTDEGKPQLLVFSAQTDICARFMEIFYSDILTAYDLETRGYSVYVSVPLPADTAQEITTLYVRIGDEKERSGS